jgi:class 3 adenylate cyclase
MLTGRYPFEGNGPLEILYKICKEPHEPIHQHNCPPELSFLVDRLLAKSPAGRPENALEIAASIERMVSANADPGSSSAGAVEGSAGPSGDLPDSQGHTRQGIGRMGERRQVTVLCCELVIDGNPSGTPDPESLLQVLPPFQALGRKAVERFAGHLADLEGHRWVAYFGYPFSYEDNARRAVLAALEIVAASRQVGDRNGPGWVARAGIHTGPAVRLSTSSVAGHLALGSTLDLATAIQEQAPPGALWVSAATHGLIEGLFYEKPLAPLPLPGTGKSLEVHGVTAARVVHSRVEVAGTLPPLIARERELDLLVDRFRLALEGTGQAISLTGEAGLGKTRLLRALQRRLKGAFLRDPWWLTVHGSPYAGHLPLLPAAQLLAQLLESRSGGAPGTRRTELEDRLQELEMATPETLHALSSLLEVSLTSERSLSSEKQQIVLEKVPELLLEIVEERGEREQATVLVFENLQWFDTASLDLVHRLVERCDSAPLLLVLASRPEVQAPRARHGHWTSIHLESLDPTQARLLIDGLAGEDALPVEVSEEIVERSAGVPSYLEALTREALQAEAPRGLSETDIPASLYGELAAKLDRLGTAKDLAQIGALLGPEFTYWDLAALWPPHTTALDNELERLLEARIFSRAASSTDHFRFGHPMLQTAALASLLEEDRALLERRIHERRGGTTVG